MRYKRWNKYIMQLEHLKPESLPRTWTPFDDITSWDVYITQCEAAATANQCDGKDKVISLIVVLWKEAMSILQEL